MRLLFVICAHLLLVNIAFSQEATLPEQIIKRIVTSGGYEGHDSKAIGRMGDAAAVAVTKVLAGGALEPHALENVLLVLTSAFADPRLVEDASDREPRTALLVLNYLDLSTINPGLKQKIADTRSYLQQQAHKARNVGRQDL